MEGWVKGMPLVLYENCGRLPKGFAGSDGIDILKTSRERMLCSFDFIINETMYTSVLKQTETRI